MLLLVEVAFDVSMNMVSTFELYSGVPFGVYLPSKWVCVKKIYFSPEHRPSHPVM